MTLSEADKDRYYKYLIATGQARALVRHHGEYLLIKRYTPTNNQFTDYPETIDVEVLPPLIELLTS